MEVTYNQILGLNEGLNKVTKEMKEIINNEEKKYSIKRSFRIKVIRLMQIIEVESEAYNVLSQEIIDKYQDKEAKSDPGFVKIKTEKMPEFEKEMNELLSEKTDIDFKDIKLTDEELENIPLEIEDEFKLNIVLENKIVE